MGKYGSHTAAQQNLYPQTDKVIAPGSEYTGEWSSAQISGEVLSIEFTIDGVVTDKTADIGGTEFVGLVTAGYGGRITAIQLTSGAAVLYL